MYGECMNNDIFRLIFRLNSHLLCRVGVEYIDNINNIIITFHCCWSYSLILTAAEVPNGNLLSATDWVLRKIDEIFESSMKGDQCVNSIETSLVVCIYTKWVAYQLVKITAHAAIITSHHAIYVCMRNILTQYRSTLSQLSSLLVHPVWTNENAAYHFTSAASLAAVSAALSAAILILISYLHLYLLMFTDILWQGWVVLIIRHLTTLVI